MKFAQKHKNTKTQAHVGTVYWAYAYARIFAVAVQLQNQV